jgi:hypothetical protein
MNGPNRRQLLMFDSDGNLLVANVLRVERHDKMHSQLLVIAEVTDIEQTIDHIQFHQIIQQFIRKEPIQVPAKIPGIRPLVVRDSMKGGKKESGRKQKNR